MALAGIEIRGTTGNDNLTGTSGDDTIYGLGGSDVLLGLDGDDKLQSSFIYDPQTRIWRADDKGDFIDGGKGDDELQGGLSNDTLIGGEGKDNLYGGGGRDVLKGGAGDDILQSGEPWDPDTELYSPDLVGDTLDGGDGDDILVGEDGDDVLDGGSGANILAGGKGNDTYHVRSALDLVYDSGGNDRGTIYADWTLPIGTIENWTWAPGVQRLPNWIAALAEQAPQARMSGATHVVEYHFAESPAAFFDDQDKDGFEAFNAAQRAFARKVFDYISTVVNVEFRETGALDGEGVLVLANNLQDDSAGYAHSQLVMLNHDVWQNLAPTMSNAGVQILLHEVGHALGLKHPFDDVDSVGTPGQGPFLSSVEDIGEHTLMSYNVEPSDYHLAYSALDLAALQYIYGPAAQVAAGDTSWRLDAGRNNFIADGAGADTLDGSAFAGGMTVDLRPGYWGFMGAKADSIVRAGQVTVNFGSVIENLRGGAGNDTLTGNEIANRIEGGAGNDAIAGGAGSDQLDGGAGLDVAVYAGKLADFSFKTGPDGIAVSDRLHPADTDLLAGIERLKFDDAMVALDTDGVAAQAYRLYQAAFNRTPDLGGLGYWIGQMERGASLKEVAANFIASGEFTGMYGLKPANADFLTKIYQNILHRAPDQAGFDYWLQAMEQGTSAVDILAQFSESRENVVALAGVVDAGIAYTPFG